MLQIFCLPGNKNTLYVIWQNPTPEHAYCSTVLATKTETSLMKWSEGLYSSIRLEVFVDNFSDHESRASSVKRHGILRRWWHLNRGIIWNTSAIQLITSIWPHCLGQQNVDHVQQQVPCPNTPKFISQLHNWCICGRISVDKGNNSHRVRRLTKTFQRPLESMLRSSWCCHRLLSAIWRQSINGRLVCSL